MTEGRRGLEGHRGGVEGRRGDRGPKEDRQSYKLFIVLQNGFVSLYFHEALCFACTGEKQRCETKETVEKWSQFLHDLLFREQKSTILSKAFSDSVKSTSASFFSYCSAKCSVFCCFVKQKINKPKLQQKAALFAALLVCPVFQHQTEKLPKETTVYRVPGISNLKQKKMCVYDFKLICVTMTSNSFFINMLK